MSQNFLRTLAALALLATVGCDDDDQASDGVSYQARTIEDGLFFAPTGAGDEQEAIQIDVSAGDPKTSRLPLPGGGVTAVARPGTDGREVVVLTSGLEAVRTGKHKRPAIASSLLVFGHGGQLVRKDLQGRYTKLALSPDGRYGIAFGTSAGLSVDNSAEIVDFSSQAAPVFIDLSLDARAPTSFTFSAPGSFTHKVAVAPQPNALQIIDLEHPEQGPISITLTAKSTLTPTQLVFADDRMFVRSQGSAEIVVLQAIEIPQQVGRSWQLAPQELFATNVVRDIAVTGSGASQRLLALTGSLEVFDPAIGPTAKIDGLGNFSRILQFEGTSPIDQSSTKRAMLYGEQVARDGVPSVASSQVAFVDLGDETAWTTRNVETVELGDTVLSLTPLTKQKLALTRQSSTRAAVIDLQARTVRRLVLNEYDGSLLLDEGGAQPQLWARGTTGALGRVNLDDFSRIELPYSFGSYGESDGDQSLLSIPSQQRRRLAVLQPARTGRVTFIDADATSGDAAAESALELLGIYLHDLLD
jgi:hypothetical protein